MYFGFRMKFCILSLTYFFLSFLAANASQDTAFSLPKDECFYDYWYGDGTSPKVWCGSDSDGRWKLFEQISNTGFGLVNEINEPAIFIGWFQQDGSVKTAFFNYERNVITVYDANGSELSSTDVPPSFKMLDISVFPPTMRFGRFRRLARNPHQDCAVGIDVNVTERIITAVFVDLNQLEAGFESSVVQRMFFLDESLNLTPFVEKSKVVCYSVDGQRRIAFTVNGQAGANEEYVRQGSVLAADFSTGIVTEVFQSPSDYQRDTLKMSPTPQGVIVQSVSADLYVGLELNNWTETNQFHVGRQNGFIQASPDTNSILVLALRDYSDTPRLGYSIITQCEASDLGCLFRIRLPTGLTHYHFSEQFWPNELHFIVSNESGELFALRESDIFAEIER